MRFLLHGSRMVADTVVGYVLVTAGVVMLLTPGPGLVAIVAGLAVLGRHYRWAAWLRATALGRIRDAGTRLRARRAAHRADPSGRPGDDEDRREPVPADAA